LIHSPFFLKDGKKLSEMVVVLLLCAAGDYVINELGEHEEQVLE
jgi:hypothetical protein